MIHQNNKCQTEAHKYLDCYVRHFKLISESMEFVGKLLSQNKELIETLENNFEIELLFEKLPDIRKHIMDIVIKDKEKT